MTLKDLWRAIKGLRLRHVIGSGEARKAKRLKRGATLKSAKAKQDYLDRMHAEHLQEAATYAKQERSAQKARKLAAMMKLPHKPVIGQDMVRRHDAARAVPRKPSGPKPLSRKNLIQ